MRIDLTKTLCARMVNPALSGRYASNTLPSLAAKLSNEGVPVQIEHSSGTVSEAVAHLPSTPDHISPCFFATTDCEKFLPRKHVGHIDAGSPDMPPLAIKLTYFRGAGTAIGILISHCFCDADSIIGFMQNWSRCYCGLELQVTPLHDRCVVLRMPIKDTASQPSGDFFAKQIDVIQRGSKWIPGFAPVMPKIMGQQACVIPCPGTEVKAWKASACGQVPTDCKFVSTDDVVSARIWQALVRVRCQQVGVATDSDEPTTIMRAMNIRKRTSPPLGPGYCGNGVFGVWTQLTVRECLSMTPGHIAARLRSTLCSWTPDTISAYARWLQGHHKDGSLTKTRFDRFALTFVVSSWGFKWEDVNFKSKPLCFDHGAFVPIVAVLSPRHNCDGVNVWVSGKEDDVSRFIEYLKA